MPYIRLAGRNRLDNGLHAMLQYMPVDAGELNYVLTRICDTYVNTKGKNYQNLNEVVGVIECMKQEFYRRVIIPFENIKIDENGDVYGKITSKPLPPALPK
jgi:hypothetical protein